MTRKTEADLRRRIESLHNDLGALVDQLHKTGNDYAQENYRRRDAEQREQMLKAAIADAGLTLEARAEMGRLVSAKITGVNNVVKSAIRDTATQAALALVIEALDLKGYQRARFTQDVHSFVVSTTVKDPAAPRLDELARFDTVRFEKDLITALDVRAERKAQAKRDATEKKVAGLTKPAPVYAVDLSKLNEALGKFATGGYTTRPDKTVDETLDAAERED